MPEALQHLAIPEQKHAWHAHDITAGLADAMAGEECLQAPLPHGRPRHGIGYAIAARDPYRYWPIVLVGLLGKIFGPIGFLFSDLPWTSSRGA